MSRKHFVALAAAIAKLNTGKPVEFTEIVNVITEFAAAQNPNFDRKRFIDACTVEA